MTQILSGKEVAMAVKERTTALAAELAAKGHQPRLAIVRVGERTDDLYYQSSLQKTCLSVGLDNQVFAYPLDISQEELEKAVAEVAADPAIHGILLFCPLPKTLNEKAIRERIPQSKDVDCLTNSSLAAIFTDAPEGFPPCTAGAVMETLHYYDIPIKGRHAVVIGRSLVVGKPLAMLLLREHATVTVCHSRSIDLPAICRKADILIAAVGKAKMVDASYTHPEQVLIDVGINDDPDNQGKMCGDVDYDSASAVAGWITPVPGGIGSVTSSLLCWHTTLACKSAISHNQ